MDKLLKTVHSFEMNELHRLVQENRLEAVKFLVAKNADVTNTIDNGYTSLHLATSLNQGSLVKELLKGKPREELRFLINTKTFDLDNALFMALRNNSFETTILHLSNGACFDAWDKNLRRPVELTTEKNIQELFCSIERIFKTISNQHQQRNQYETDDIRIILNELNCRSAEFLTAVMYARNSENLTALQAAMKIEHLDIIGEIINFRNEKLKHNNWQGGGHFDKLMHYFKVARHHLSHLDFSPYSECYGEKRKSISVGTKVKQHVFDLLQSSSEFLKAYKIQHDPSLENQPLLIIIEESLEFFNSKYNPPRPIGEMSKEKIKEIESILNQREYTNIKNMLMLCIIAPIQLFMQQVYSSELLYAAKNNDISLVEKCLTGHPDLNKRDETNKWTPLHYALDYTNNGMAKLLLNFGADPASLIEKGQKKRTTLHVALCHSVSAEVIKLIFKNVKEEKLVDYVNARADDNSTALHLAAKSHYFRLVEFLLSKGAFYCPEDASENMPEDYCYSHNKLRELFELTKRSFRLACNGKAEELLQVIIKLDKSSFLAVTGARNEEGLTLEQIFEIEGRCDDAEKIRGIFSSEHDYYKHADDFVLSKPRNNAHQ